MKMKLTLVLLVFLGVGALARSPARTSEVMEEVANELNERYARSASGEASEVAAGEPLGKSREGDLEAVRNGGGMNGNGMSGENKSEKSSETEKKAELAKSGEEDKSPQHESSEENKGGSKESSQSGGKSEESCEEGGQLNGGGTGTLYGMYATLKPLAKMLGLSKVSNIPALVAKYYSGNLPVLLESLLKSAGITTSLQEMQDPSGLYQTMKSIPIVGTMVKFMTDTMLIPINIIAIIFTLGTTIMQHMYNSIPNIL